MNDFRDGFERALESFPGKAREILREIPGRAGKLEATACHDLTMILGIGLEDLMTRLLPVAELYVDAPISRFKVGAAARASVADGKEGDALFLGANMEFPGQPLHLTIHAEQAASMNAWSRGAGRLHAIAVSQPPCGYCRQFLNEFEGAGGIRVIVPERGGDGAFVVNTLSELLPMSFGPGDLQNTSGLGAPNQKRKKLELAADGEDPVVLEALRAAEKSHAPYTGNFAGCAIQTDGGRILSGGYVENAAFNPTFSPFHTVYLRMRMNAPEGVAIKRVVLVERPGSILQETIVNGFLKFIAPDIKLEYYIASNE